MAGCRREVWLYRNRLIGQHKEKHRGHNHSVGRISYRYVPHGLRGISLGYGWGDAYALGIQMPWRTQAYGSSNSSQDDGTAEDVYGNRRYAASCGGIRQKQGLWRSWPCEAKYPVALPQWHISICRKRRRKSRQHLWRNSRPIAKTRKTLSYWPD